LKLCTVKETSGEMKNAMRYHVDVNPPLDPPGTRVNAKTGEKILLTEEEETEFKAAEERAQAEYRAATNKAMEGIEARKGKAPKQGAGGKNKKKGRPLTY
jgi:hypothetical protein